MSKTFTELGVAAPVAQRLTERGIQAPFPIQAATIPEALAGRDLCGKAPTGSGKTIAFAIPMIAHVTRAAPKRPKGLVLTPTRELATQVADEIRALSGDLRVLAVYGGAGIEPQLKKLRNGVDIVVACPGRLLDVIDRKACDLRDVCFAVVDEADRMADMGFLPDVRRILDQTNDDRQTLLFSATLDGAIDALVKGYQHDPVVHEMAEEDGGEVAHHLWTSERPERPQLTAEIIERVGPTIVFSRTRHGADRIAKQIGRLGVTAAPIHGGRSQGQRERALDRFHRGEVMALIATDVAARGIHVGGVACVVHYDIPADHKDYVHRSGRTGRAGADGTVVALVPTAQRRDAAKVLRQAGVKLEAEASEPAVALLPAGYQAFSKASRSPAGKATKSNGSNGRGGSGRGGSSKAGNGRGDDRFDTTGPPHRAKGSTSSGKRGRPSSGEQQHSGRAKANPGSAGSGKAADAPGGGAPQQSKKNGSSNRAERRQARFGEADSAERKARAAAKADGKGQPSNPSGRSDGRRRGPSAQGGSSSDEGDRFDQALTGSGKVRPSGASRRKAKREAERASGEAVDPAKKRRSGRSRPPAERARRR